MIVFLLAITISFVASFTFYLIKGFMQARKGRS